MSGRRDEAGRKLARVRAWLHETGREAVLLASQPNFAWATAGGARAAWRWTPAMAWRLSS
jgi:Xaa-Pro aminopeptidase